MNEDRLHELWMRSDAPSREVTPDDLRRELRPFVARQEKYLRTQVLAHLPLLAVTVLVSGANMLLALDDAGALAVITAVTVAAVGFLTFGLHLRRELRTLSAADLPLVDFVRRRAEFFRTKLEIWHVMVAGSVVLAAVSAAAFTDLIGGSWRVNDPQLLARLLIGIFTFVYVLTKLGAHPHTAASAMLLADLREQTLERTNRLSAFWRRWRIGGVVLVVGCFVLVLALVWKSTAMLSD